MEKTPAPSLFFTPSGHRDFLAQMREGVRAGMTLSQKSIPCTYLYDARGSRLFDLICSLPEYYLTRIEMDILRTHARTIMDFFLRATGDLVDMGSGSDLKARELIRAMAPSPAGRFRYIPVDISHEGLALSCRGLLRDFAGIEVLCIVGDFTCAPDFLPRGRKLICFFGSTLGNFPPVEAVSLLGGFARSMGPDDRLLVGMDMLKPVEIIEAAYNDSSGVTAQFNLNVLGHVNDRLHADFVPGDFEHVAFFNRDQHQVEMHLRAVRPMEVRIGDIGLTVPIARGETIRTEISRKFSRTAAEEMFCAAGLVVAGWYADERGWFSLAELRRA
jgi:L-histidine Nalpha-methyltransferase